MRFFNLMYTQKHFYIFIILYIESLFCFFPLHALDPNKRITQYDIQIYKSEHGLPMNSIKKVFQCSKGYIWIGTQEGLVRFDGVNFKIYDKSKFPGLKSNFIYDIDEDENGNLWLATWGGGISCFDGKSFTTFDKSDSLIHETVEHILVGRDGSIWIGTKTGLSRYINNHFYNYSIENGLLYNQITSIYEDQEGNLFIGSAGSGFNVFRNDTMYSFNYDDSFMVFNGTQDGDIIAGTFLGELFKFQNFSIENFNINSISSVINLQQSYKDITMDSNGNYWICTDGGGIYRYYKGKLNNLNADNSQIIDNNFFLTVMEDREHNIWIGSEDGLIQIKDNKFISIGRSEGLETSFSHTICEDNNENICIGFRKKGLSIIKKDYTNIETYNIPMITTLTPSTNGVLWIGTEINGLFLFNYRIHPYSLRKIESGQSWIYSLLMDNKNNLWIGGRGSITKFTSTTKKIYPFEILYNKYDVITLLQSMNDDIWFGTRGGGLYRIKNNQVIRKKNPVELLSGGVNALYEDKDGILWIGTDNLGLYQFKNNTYLNYSSWDGLYTDRIFSILEDDSLNLWFSTNKGIFSANKQNLKAFSEGKINKITCNVYNHLDGMRESECNGRRQPSAWKSSDGKLWFTSIAGVVSIDPNNIPVNKVIPPVYIESITTGDTIYYYQNSKVLLNEKERDVEFKYTALSYAVPERVKFKYWLKGFDHDWVEAGANRVARYTNLDKGNYTFHVIACNNDGIWNQDGASIKFAIAPFWHETWWAYIGYFILFALFIWWVINLRTRKLIYNEQFKMHKEQSERLAEIDEMKSNFFANISHEFRTPLTLILSPLKQIMSDNEIDNPQKYYEVMYRNASRLKKLINQILDLSKLEAGRMELQTSPVNIISILKTLVLSFSSLAESKNISLNFNYEFEKIVAYIDNEKLEKIINNLLSNTLKFTPKGGIVNVSILVTSNGKPQNSQSFDFNSRFIEITIEDNGNGIPADHLENIFNRFYQSDDSHTRDYEGTGIGLALVKELVDVHKGYIRVESKVGEGSKFTVQLPLGKDHLNEDEIFEKPISSLSEREEFDDIIMIPDSQINDSKKVTPLNYDNLQKPLLLIVEDNLDLQNHIQTSLNKNFHILIAHNGEEGLDKALRVLPDLIISDVRMPKMDGFELCKRLKTDEKTSHIPIILLTALAGPENKIEGLEIRADDYLTKPFDIKELEIRSKNLIEIRKQLRERYSGDITNQIHDIIINRYDKQFLEKAIKIIDDHLSEQQFKVTDLANEIGWSRETVYRKIKALTDMTAEKFLYDRRIRRAEYLLRESDYTSTEIAMETGYSNPSHFAKHFKERFGQSPREYRYRTTNR